MTWSPSHWEIHLGQGIISSSKEVDDNPRAQHVPPPPPVQKVTWEDKPTVLYLDNQRCNKNYEKKNACSPATLVRLCNSKTFQPSKPSKTVGVRRKEIKQTLIRQATRTKKIWHTAHQTTATPPTGYIIALHGSTLQHHACRADYSLHAIHNTRCERSPAKRRRNREP